MLGNLTKSIVGIAFSPVAIAADFITLGGLMLDRNEPYTVTTFRSAMRNLELAFDPDDLSDEQVSQIIREIEKRNR